MEEQEMLQITVIIAGRPYPLKIQKGDEATIRDIVKEINDKVNKFQQAYRKKDKQDCLTMTLLTYAVDMHKIQNSREDNAKNEMISNRLQQIDKLLETMVGA